MHRNNFPALTKYCSLKLNFHQILYLFSAFEILFTANSLFFLLFIYRCVCVFFLEIYVAFNMNIPKLVRRLTYFNSYTFTFCNSNTNILFIQSYTVHREHADIFLLSSPNVFFGNLRVDFVIMRIQIPITLTSLTNISCNMRVYKN